MEVDFSELKNDTGRPSEDIVKRVNLKPYIVESHFQKRLVKFFDNWDTFVKAKAKEKQKYINNMEEFYGEVLEKFGTLSNNKQKTVLKADKPLALLYKLTNLSQPNVFHDKADNDYFIEELKNTGL